MSKGFEGALNSHMPKPVNHLEFRRIWAPVWANLCHCGETYFVQEANQVVPNYAVAYLLMANVALGRDILGQVEYNRLVALINDATAKFNARATNSDVHSHKVLSALNEAINNGYIS